MSLQTDSQTRMWLPLRGFCQSSQNAFVLKDSNSPAEFTKRLKSLPKHARDIHVWTENGKTQCCDFHPLQICCCGKCKKGEALTCKGKPYTTRNKLTCDFHSLMYQIEIENRASMADSYIHPILKRGHSNWLEASHSVMIHFRSKDVALQRLHYEVSTNLALLQSNMTYMWEKRGKEYHWIPDLYKRLGLPLYEGMENAYTMVNVKRKRGLDRKKQNVDELNCINIEQLSPKERSGQKSMEVTLMTHLAVEKCRIAKAIKKFSKKTLIWLLTMHKIFHKIFVMKVDEDEYLYELSEDEWDDEPVCICPSVTKSHKPTESNPPINQRRSSGKKTKFIS